MSLLEPQMQKKDASTLLDKNGQQNKKQLQTQSSTQPAAAMLNAADFGGVLGPPGSHCRYEKIKLLGCGSFGKAWLVQRTADGMHLVAKVMDLSAMSSRDQKYMEAEIQCLAACNHFAVIRHIEDFVVGNFMLIIMEFADAGDLNMQIKARAARAAQTGQPEYLEEHEVAYTFLQLCMGVDHVHRHRMLHRDIKGANILLMGSGLVKLGDFGFSQQYEDTVSGAVAGTFCGTPYYLAPEVWRRQRYSKKADVWSLGILLYEMMALKRPFEGQGMKVLMESVLTGQLAPLPSRYSKELQELCYSILVPDPNQRPSIAELFQKPYMQQILSDYEHSSLTSPAIDNETKVLIQQGIADIRAIRPPSASNNKRVANSDGADGGAAEAIAPATHTHSHIGPVGKINPEVYMEGKIRKESNNVWKDRYFVLKDGQLTISIKKGDADTKSISVTILSSVVPVPANKANREGAFALNTTDNKTMWMQAPSKEECAMWIHRIQQAMGVA